jgi:hypothetical protein
MNPPCFVKLNSTLPGIPIGLKDNGTKDESSFAKDSEDLSAEALAEAEQILLSNPLGVRSVSGPLPPKHAARSFSLPLPVA